jgi:hypothetical protein
MNFRKIGSVLVLLPGLGACATITRGTHEAYVIESEPPGATAKLSTGIQCVTPCALNIKRKNGFTVDMTKDGYETVHATVTSGVSGGGAAGMAGNLILGGIIGAVVDGTNGSMNELRPNPLHVNMVRLNGLTTAGDATSVAPGAPTVGSHKVRANTASGYCLDVPPDYVGTGAENSPAVTSGMPRCSSLSAGK